MKALVYDNNVVDLAETEFEVSPEFTWMDAPDGCVAGEWILDGNGDLVENYTGLTAEEHMRYLRDKLLEETDWWANSDRTMTDAQTAYRTALRDLPATSSPAWGTAANSNIKYNLKAL